MSMSMYAFIFFSRTEVSCKNCAENNTQGSKSEQSITSNRHVTLDSELTGKWTDVNSSRAWGKYTSDVNTTRRDVMNMVFFCFWFPCAINTFCVLHSGF